MSMHAFFSQNYEKVMFSVNHCKFLGMNRDYFIALQVRRHEKTS